MEVTADVRRQHREDLETDTLSVFRVVFMKGCCFSWTFKDEEGFKCVEGEVKNRLESGMVCEERAEEVIFGIL